MKFYYPKDMDGNVIGFKTPESQVYDKAGKSLTDKLNEIYDGTTALGNAVSIQSYAPNTGGKKGLATISSDYGVTQLGNSIEFHTKDNTTYTAKMSVDSSGDILIDNQYITNTSLLRYKDLHSEKTDINGLVATGIYRCDNFTNYPPEHPSGQGTVFVFNYYGNASNAVTNTMGTDNLWLTQIFLSAHNYAMWKRSVSNTEITSWVSMSVNHLDSYDDMDMISFAEDSNYCPDGTVSHYRLYHPTNAPVSTSDFNVEIYRLSSACIRILAYQITSTDVWTNVKVNDEWIGWKNLNDNNNATSVQGLEPSTNGKRGLVTILEDYGLMEIGNKIDFHSADNQDFLARLWVDETGNISLFNQYDTSGSAFFKYKNTGGAVNINSLIASGIYRGTAFVNYPKECMDGQGTVIVINFTGGNSPINTAVAGTDPIWLTQFYISAHDSNVWKRNFNLTTIGEWVNSSNGGNAGLLGGLAKDSFVYRDGSNAYLNSVTDLNTFYTGIGLFQGSSVSNLPSTDWHLVIAGGVAGTQSQIAFNLFNYTNPKIRHCAAGTWHEWTDMKAEYIPLNGGYIGGGYGRIYIDPNAVLIYAHSVAGDSSTSNALLISNEKYQPKDVDTLSLRCSRAGSTVDYVLHNDGNSSRVKITNDATAAPSNTHTLWAY